MSTPISAAKKITEITFNRKIVGWQCVSITRETLDDIVKPGAETEEAFKKRLDGIWEVMCEYGDSLEFEDTDLDDVAEVGDIEYDDDELVGWVEAREAEWEETNKICVLTGECKSDWNDEDEMIDTEVGPMRDMFADYLPQFKELLKVKEKDDTIAKLKAEMDVIKKATGWDAYQKYISEKDGLH